MLFNEPKLLKSTIINSARSTAARFSALQRAEIAEIMTGATQTPSAKRFSALQRAEIAEILAQIAPEMGWSSVSVLFNEPKLLKFAASVAAVMATVCFSALQRAEIAEIKWSMALVVQSNHVSVLFNEPKLLKYPNTDALKPADFEFQCSSTSRNC